MQKDEANKIINILKHGKQFTMEDISKLSQLPYVGPPRCDPGKDGSLSEMFDRLDRQDARERVFCKQFANVPLQDIVNYYGENTVMRVKEYFKLHPSPRFLWIQNGCIGPEPKV